MMTMSERTNRFSDAQRDVAVAACSPALPQKVTYNAEQITKEMQGVRVTGFVVWYIIHYFTALL